jgi:hypothetical protein
MTDINIEEASNGPLEGTAVKRVLGADAGLVVIADDFDEPLDPETMS